MQPTPHQAHDADDGFERWYLGGAPGADDEEPMADPGQRPLVPAPAPVSQRTQREGWLAAAGSMAALALLWSFYGVVDGAVERSAMRAQAPMEASAGEGSAQIDRVHAIYSMPDATNAGSSTGGNAAPTVHYTRWP